MAAQNMGEATPRFRTPTNPQLKPLAVGPLGGRVKVKVKCSGALRTPAYQ